MSEAGQGGSTAPLKTYDEQQREDVGRWFTYHAPTAGQVPRYEALREGGKRLAMTLLTLCPPSADRTVALRKLRECVMTANASIALETPQEGKV